MIKVLKLHNGDDIIADIQDEQVPDEMQDEVDPAEDLNDITRDLLFLREPMKIVHVYDPNTEKYRINIIRWLPFSDDEIVPLSIDWVVATCDPNSYVIQGYHKACQIIMDDRTGTPRKTTERKALPESHEETTEKDIETRSQELLDLLSLINSDDDKVH